MTCALPSGWQIWFCFCIRAGPSSLARLKTFLCHQTPTSGNSYYSTNIEYPWIECRFVTSFAVKSWVNYLLQYLLTVFPILEFRHHCLGAMYHAPWNRCGHFDGTAPDDKTRIPTR